MLTQQFLLMQLDPDLGLNTAKGRPVDGRPFACAAEI
jgi:hypothetical protein